MDHKELITPYNTNEFYAMMTALRAHHNVMSDADREMAAELNRLLPRAKGGKLAPARLDLKWYARRVTMHLVHAAACNQASAKAYQNAYNTYINLFTNHQGGGHGRSFDVN